MARAALCGPCSADSVLRFRFRCRQSALSTLKCRFRWQARPCGTALSDLFGPSSADFVAGAALCQLRFTCLDIFRCVFQWPQSDPVFFACTKNALASFWSGVRLRCVLRSALFAGHWKHDVKNLVLSLLLSLAACGLQRFSARLVQES